MQGVATGIKAEPRWPAILSLAFVFGLLLALPARYSVAPAWLHGLGFISATASMIAVSLRPTVLFWQRLELAVVMVVGSLVTLIQIETIARLTLDMVHHSHRYDSLTLLESAVACWTVNIVAFALMYWQLDRTSLEIRQHRFGGSDFIFAEAHDRKTEPPWEPVFFDYVYLAFVTSTSFAPPDYSRPRSRRAKCALMVQSTISLATLVVIGSRAISTFN